MKEEGQPDIWMYHRFDGYPEKVGVDLKSLVDNLNKGWRWSYREDNLDGLADWMCDLGVPSPIDSTVDEGYEHDDGIGGDIEYLYSITRVEDRYTLECTYRESTYLGDSKNSTYKDWSNRDNWHVEWVKVDIPSL